MPETRVRGGKQLERLGIHTIPQGLPNIDIVLRQRLRQRILCKDAQVLPPSRAGENAKQEQTQPHPCHPFQYPSTHRTTSLCPCSSVHFLRPLSCAKLL